MAFMLSLQGIMALIFKNDYYEKDTFGCNCGYRFVWLQRSQPQ
jgi:hypothetical protein